MLNQLDKECYQGKLAFIKNLNDVFANHSYSGIPVIAVKLEFYDTPFGLEEYVVVVYRGGAYAPCRANWNSNSANFRIVSNLINGGYYDEVDAYDKIKSSYPCINEEILAKEGE